MDERELWHEQISAIWSTYKYDYKRPDPFPSEFASQHKSIESMIAKCSRPQWIFWSLAQIPNDQKIQVIDFSIPFLREIWLQILQIEDFKQSEGITKICEFLKLPTTQVTRELIDSINSTIMAIRTKGSKIHQQPLFWNSLTSLVEAKILTFEFLRDGHSDNILGALSSLASATFYFDGYIRTSKFDQQWDNMLRDNVLGIMNSAKK